MPDAVIGVSGGVDSAASASLLLDRGYNVTGVYLKNGYGDDAPARAVAEALNIPFVSVDVGLEMERHVISAFQNSYAAGYTPNPCVLCNPAVKFRALFSQAERLGAEYVATGHYARAENGRLYQGHPLRDQSYMLCRLPAEWLPRLLFPIGMWDKAAVRAYAAEKNLRCAGQSDSMEICFIPEGDYASFLESRGLSMPEGDFVDINGSILGRHKGIHHYTVGQRRGLGIPSAGRLYVTALDAEKSRVVLGPESELMTNRARVADISWLDEPSSPLRCQARVRHSKTAYPCKLDYSADSGVITFDRHIRKPSPGQSAVFYVGGQVLGAGTVMPDDWAAGNA